MVTTQAIVLNVVKYQEKNLIVKCFTETDGIKTFFVRGAVKKSYFQPLNLLQISFQSRNKSELFHFKTVEILHPYQSLQLDYKKSVVVFFLSEFLYKILREEYAQKELFHFIKNTLLFYDSVHWNPDFHICFLMKITKYLGFYPDDSTVENPYFNVKEGGFESVFSYNCLPIEESDYIKKAMLTQWDKVTIFNGNERKKIVKTLLNYIQLHSHSKNEFQSLQIVDELI